MANVIDTMAECENSLSNQSSMCTSMSEKTRGVFFMLERGKDIGHG